MNERRARFGAESLLILVMFFWGTTFVAVKDILGHMDVHWFHTLRFTLAAVAMWGVAALPGRGEAAATRFSGATLRAGGLIGVALFLAFALQTLGLVTTTATKSAFLTATSVLWVPPVALVFFRALPDRKAMVAGLAGFAGIFLLVLERGWAAFADGGVVVGDYYTLLCAASIAVHLLLTKRYAAGHDVRVLTAVQLSVTAVLSLACSILWGETRSFAHPMGVFWTIVFLALVTSAFNLWAVTFAQRFTTAQRTAVIYLFEPLFAAATAWVWLGEQLTSRQWCGAALILGSVVMLEAWPNGRRPEAEADAPHSP